MVCPECGAAGAVTVNRRESHDFCERCDFPLFWTPTELVLGDQGTVGDALRRLPGTAGRVSVGSVACPHCREANPVTAERCLRCDGDLHPAPPPPPPAPEPIAPPPPPPAPEPEPEPVAMPWWWWAIGGLTVVLVVAIVAVLIWG